MQTLADYLGTSPASQEPAGQRLEDITDTKAFAEAVLNSFEFRQYIVHGLTLGSLPPAILNRIMDMAGWPGGAKRVEHSGPNGKPIEMITEVRRVVVRPHVPVEDEEKPSPYVTH